ncbi:tRNA1(Val) (adenine(37)-N6)-methyltransferase [Nitratireductor luteus]|uniref:tRNA1(Val) (adenine(37)-N6)-methyltransferase n=1 Tax=Nitratireductor luteus TaxID=2976980 RepID=UPI00223F7DC5|nr:methyltransferase [Nitratireductor luteus]
MESETNTATLDAFHRGRFHLVQPAARGHRSGIDAMLLAGAVPDGFSGDLADLGAGAGAAGFAVASRCPAARVTLVERAAEMADYARRSAALRENNAFAGRTSVIEADVALAGKARVAAGLADRSYDFIIMNPPFNDARDRATPHALKREAHVMEDGMFERWIKTAAAIARPSAGLAIIARAGSTEEILGALGGRFGGIEMLPIHPHEDEAAIRIVVRAIKGSRGGLRILPGLILHRGTPGYCAHAEAVINGQAALFGD